MPDPALRFTFDLIPFERAISKVKHLGVEAQLTLPEAASILDVSESTFERLAIPCTLWAGRTRRWRYGNVIEHGRGREQTR